MQQNSFLISYMWTPVSYQFCANHIIITHFRAKTDKVRNIYKIIPKFYPIYSLYFSLNNSNEKGMQSSYITICWSLGNIISLEKARMTYKVINRIHDSRLIQNRFHIYLLFLSALRLTFTDIYWINLLP